MLSKYRDHLSKIRYCIDENEKVIQRILQDVDQIFQNENQTVVRPDSEQIIRVREMDLDKVTILNPFHWWHELNWSTIWITWNLQVQVTLKQFARDWSSDGEEERTQCYKPIIDEILSQFNPAEVYAFRSGWVFDKIFDNLQILQGCQSNQSTCTWSWSRPINVRAG